MRVSVCTEEFGAVKPRNRHEDRQSPREENLDIRIVGLVGLIKRIPAHRQNLFLIGGSACRLGL